VMRRVKKNPQLPPRSELWTLVQAMSSNTTASNGVFASGVFSIATSSSVVSLGRGFRSHLPSGSVSSGKVPSGSVASSRSVGFPRNNLITWLV
jgi:hypothetical protein